jgi:hypothetical protein
MASFKDKLEPQGVKVFDIKSGLYVNSTSYVESTLLGLHALDSNTTYSTTVSDRDYWQDVSVNFKGQLEASPMFPRISQLGVVFNNTGSTEAKLVVTLTQQDSSTINVFLNKDGHLHLDQRQLPGNEPVQYNFSIPVNMTMSMKVRAEGFGSTNVEFILSSSVLLQPTVAQGSRNYIVGFGPEAITSNAVKNINVIVPTLKKTNSLATELDLQVVPNNPVAITVNNTSTNVNVLTLSTTSPKKFSVFAHCQDGVAACSQYLDEVHIALTTPSGDPRVRIAITVTQTINVVLHTPLETVAVITAGFAATL